MAAKDGKTVPVALTDEQITEARAKAECALEAYSPRCLGHVLAGMLLTVVNEVEEWRKLDAECKGRPADGTDKLCRAVYQREPRARDYLGGSEAKMLHDGAELIVALRAENERLRGGLHKLNSYWQGGGGPSPTEDAITSEALGIETLPDPWEEATADPDGYLRAICPECSSVQALDQDDPDDEPQPCCGVEPLVFKRDPL